DARRHAVASARHTARRRRAAAVPAGSGGAVGQRRASANGALRHAAAGPAAGAGGWCAMSTHCGCPICARFEAVSDTCRYPTPFTYLRDATPPSPPTASSLGERVGVRGASASVLARASKRFRTPAGARATFSLLAQRESSQRETAPRWHALRPSMGSGCAGGLRGFPTAHPCAGGKLAGIHAGHPADFPPPARRAIGAPGRAARSCAQKQQHPTPTLPCMQGRELQPASSRRFAFASARALASGAHDARLLFRGPSAAVSRGRSGRAAGVAREGNAFSRGQEPARKARPRLTDFPCMDAREAPPRGGLLFGLLFSWPRKRKVTRAPAGARNRFEARASTEAP